MLRGDQPLQKHVICTSSNEFNLSLKVGNNL